MLIFGHEDKVHPDGNGRRAGEEKHGSGDVCGIAVETKLSGHGSVVRLFEK